MLQLIQKLVHAFHRMIRAGLAVCHALCCALTDKPGVYLLMAGLYFLMAMLYLMRYIKG